MAARLPGQAGARILQTQRARPGMECPKCRATNEPSDESCRACGAPLSARTIVRGTVLAGRYEIRETLGHGGMGTVYKAHDLLLDETVAIKALRPDMANDPEIARRFVSEIKLARKVRHENVCGIHEYGEDGATRFIAMEFVEGVD